MYRVTKIFKLETGSAVKAFVDVVVADSILIKGLRIIQGKTLFVSMPREKGKDGRWYETIRPLTKEAKEELSSVVLSAYHDTI